MEGSTLLRVLALLLGLAWMAGGHERYVDEKDVSAYERYNQAVELQRQGLDDQALAAYEEAINMKHDLTEAYINAGTILLTHDQGPDALRLFEIAVSTADLPRLRSDAYNNIGHVRYTMARSDLGMIQAALADYSNALTEWPDNVDALYNMGKSLEDLGRWEKARAAFEKVLSLDATHPTAHLNLGNYYLRHGDDEAALRHHRMVINGTRASRRDVHMALTNAGQVLRLRNDHEGAKQAFLRCLEIDEGDAVAMSNVMIARRSLCEWVGLEDTQGALCTRLARDLQQPDAWPRGGQRTLPPYDGLLLPSTSASLQLALTRAYLSGLLSISRCQLRNPLPPPHPLRVTYMSYDFRDHPMGHLTQGILTSHQRSRFAIQAASYGPDDQSAYRKRIQAGVHTFTDLSVLGDIEAACGAVAHDFTPHIVVDLMGVTRGTRSSLMALKPAPISVNYLGYPGTMGAGYVDYIIVDRVVAPAETAARAFSERVVVLPHSYQANDYDPTLPLAGFTVDARRSTEGGLTDPGGTLSLCNFNHMDKMEPVSFATWLAVMRRVPTSRLFLLEPSGPTRRAVVSTLRGEAAARGVHPSRVVFLARVPKDEHVSRLTECDIFVDTFTYGAHSTASDALFAGVPVVTMPGYGGNGDLLGKFQSRVGASLLTALGAEHTLAYSVRDTEDLIVAMLTTKQRRRAVARSLTGGVMSSTVFSVPCMTRNLERAYEVMWELHAAGLNAHHIIVHPSESRESHHAETQERLIGRAMVALHECMADSAPSATARAKEALHITSRIVTSFPLNSDGWHLRGLALMSIGGEAPLIEATTCIRHAITLQPEVAFYHVNLAEAYIRLQRTSDARLAFYESLMLDPTELPVVVRLQGLLLDGKLYAEESSVYEQVAPYVREYVQRGCSSTTDDGQRFLQQHAVASARLDRPKEALEVLMAAMRRCPHDHLMALRLASTLETAGDYESAIAQYTAAVKLKNRVEFKPWEGQRVHRGEGVRRVAIYCDEYGQSWWGRWGPSSLGKGLGGSEEAVIFIARELARLGRFSVEVYSNPLDDEVGYDDAGVLWLPASAYDTSSPADIFVAWRYHISLGLGEASQLSYLWLQDLPSTTTYTPTFLSTHTDAIFVLSKFHASALPPHAQPLTLVTPNALDPALIRDGPNHAHIFVYGSAPNRGLEILLRLWPRIRGGLLREGRPPPELRVYYGFSDAFVKYAVRTMGEGYQAWREEMERLLRQDGVSYLGMVDHEALSQGYAEAGFMLYPTSFPETGCVTLMKAMAMGAIPITSRFAASTLPELVGEFDMGSRPLRGERVQDDEEWADLYVQSVIDVADKQFREVGESEGSVTRHRKAMIAYARRNFLWEHVAGIWARRFDQDEIGHSST